MASECEPIEPGNPLFLHGMGRIPEDQRATVASIHNSRGHEDTETRIRGLRPLPPPSPSDGRMKTGRNLRCRIMPIMLAFVQEPSVEMGKSGKRAGGIIAVATITAACRSFRSRLLSIGLGDAGQKNTTLLRFQCITAALRQS